MRLAEIRIENFRCFGEGERRFEMILQPGLTALVGENDSGKTAVIDALRFALGTTDQEWNRLEDSDFHVDPSSREVSREIRILCKFENLSLRDQRAFVEYLTYDKSASNDPILYVNWTAKDTGEIRRGRPYRRTEVRSGKEGDGPQFDANARELLRATYLRPLRDAEQALSAGRGSRLAQVLLSSRMIKEGDEHDITKPLHVRKHNLSILGIAKLIDELLREQKAVKRTRERVDSQLKELALTADTIRGIIKISGADAPDEIRIRQMLEKLDLALSVEGKPGLGSNNLLFMACELLLLAEDEGSKLLLIEEPEAHLHAQRQLRTMKFLQDQAERQGVQVIVTTHSPNLASAIDLNNIVMIHNRRAFSLAKGQTMLKKSDYRFLQRFLDVTKANLFFAHAVVIVEGDAENILLPTLARLIRRDFTEHGVSVVNVGGIGLRRYARIFQRRDTDATGELDIPVACVTDMDVMPDCAPVVLGLVSGPEDEKWKNQKRGWRAKRDFDNETALERHRSRIEAKASGQKVKTFVSDEWTLEYDLALGPKNKEGVFTGGLAEDVFVAACLAANDDALNSGAKEKSEVESLARAKFTKLKRAATTEGACAAEEVLASHVYARFVRDRVSKPIAAQYLAEILQRKVENGELTPEQLRERLPSYLVRAIEYVTSGDLSQEPHLVKEETWDE